MPLHSLAAQLAVSPPVSTPLDFFGPVATWVKSLAGALIDTADKRASVTDEVMKVYDLIAADAGRTNVALGAAFGAARSIVEGFVTGLLSWLAANPQPAPVVPVTPQGSSAP